MLRIFTLSEFLRHSGRALKALVDGDVRLRRREGDDLVLSTAVRRDASGEALEIVGRTILELLRDPAGRQHALGAVASAVPWVALLDELRREEFLDDLCRTALMAGDLEAPDKLVGILDRWRSDARSQGRGPVRGWELRPVAIPHDLDDPSIEKATGIVELPLHVRWSAPKMTYDLSDVRDLRRVYEQVLREGTEDDVRHFVDVDALIANWGELVLPSYVRKAWAGWLRDRQIDIDVAC